MKLTKKLLPIVTLVTTASAITPIAVSCGNSLSNAEKKIDGITVDIDTLLKEGFERTIKPYSQESIYLFDASQTYLKKLKQNKSLLAEDVFDYWGNVNKDGLLYTLPVGTTGEVTIGNVEVDTTNYLLSYAMRINASIPTKVTPSEGEKLEFTTVCDLTLEMNKVPVYCDYIGPLESVPNFELWTLDLDLETLVPSTNDWSIGLNGTVDFVNSDTKAHTDVDMLLNKDIEFDTKLIELGIVNFFFQLPASYFQNSEGYVYE